MSANFQIPPDDSSCTATAPPSTVATEGPRPVLAVGLIAAASTTCSAVPVRKTVPTERKLMQEDWDEPEVLPGSTSD